MEQVHFYSLSLQDLKDLVKNNGLPAFAAQQIFDWAYRKLEVSPESWSNISKASRDFFKSEVNFFLPQIKWRGISKDGTQKFLLAMEDHQTVEAVLISSKDRLTLCASSQVGCAIGCKFCHTATQGLKRNLTAGEVVGQYMTLSLLLKAENPEKKITNIVYMGQGEPLHNFDNMKKATEIIMDDFGINLSQRKITLSTSGLVPQIERLNDFPPVNIAISLHAANNKVRTELMPINKVYDLERLFGAIKKIPLKAHRRITYEYILIRDLNDRLEDIEALIDLIEKKESKVNIIPFNEFPGSIFKRPSNEKILWFNDQLVRRGLCSTIRTTKGDDILAACGQLKSSLETT